MHCMLIVSAANVEQARKEVGEAGAFACPLVLAATDAKLGSVTHYAAGVDQETAERWTQLISAPVKRHDGELTTTWAATMLPREGVKKKARDIAAVAVEIERVK